jgi:hypothetical protein
VPDAVVVDVEARIAELVEARRPALAELVHAAVNRELVALVDLELQALAGELVHVALANANGNGTAHDDVREERRGASSTPTPELLCSRCGLRSPMKGRSICKPCRYDQENARQRHRRADRRAARAAAGEAEPPRAAAAGA